MNIDYFNGFVPSIRRRRVGGMVCVVLLHAGAWYLIANAPAKHTLALPKGPASTEIILRFYTPAPRRSDRVKGPGQRRGTAIAMAPIKHEAAEKRVPPPVVRREPAPAEARETAPAPFPAGEPASPAVQEDAASLADREKVKEAIAEIVAEDQKKGMTSKTVFKPQGSAAQKALGQAIRPRCNDDYDARAGNVQLKGLMKLPSLMLGAVSDKGCKW